MFGEVLIVIGKKAQAKSFSRFLAKNHEQTPWVLGQNLKFPKRFCIGKTSREMMFGRFLAWIKTKLKKSVFQDFWSKTMNKPLVNWVKIFLRSKGKENSKHKPKQKEAQEAIAVTKRDCSIVRPTGYGKSLVYQLLLSLCDHLAHENCIKNKSIVIVVSHSTLLSTIN